MKSILKFIRTNLIAFLSAAICIIVVISAAADETHRLRAYVGRFSNYLTYMADNIKHITERPDNIDNSAFRKFGENLITAHTMQNDGQYFVDHRLHSTSGFEFIYFLMYKGMNGKEAFNSDNVLSEDEIVFLNMLQSDLCSLADELSRYEKKGIFVDIKAVNRLLNEFDQKYGMGHKAIEMYESIFPQF